MVFTRESSELLHLVPSRAASVEWHVFHVKRSTAQRAKVEGQFPPKLQTVFNNVM